MRQPGDNSNIFDMTFFARILREERTFVFLLSGLAISLFLKPGVSAILAFLFLFYCLLNHKRSISTAVKEAPLFLLPIVLYFLYVIWVIFSEDSVTSFSEVIKRYPLLLLPVGFLIIDNKKSKKNLQFVLSVFLAACLVASLVCYGNAAFNIISNQTIYYPGLDRQSYYFSYYGLVHILNIDPIYLSMYYNLALVIVIHTSVIRKLWLRIAIESYLALFVVMIASKIGVITLIVLLFTFIIMRFRKVWVSLMISAFLVLSFGFAIYKLSFLRERFIVSTQFDFSEPNGEVWNSVTLRLAIWTCAIDAIKKRPLMGYGTGDGQSALEREYAERNFVWGLAYKQYAVSRYNAHNEFFAVALELGVLGLILLSSMIVWPLVSFLKGRYFLALGFIIIVLLSFCIESVLYRHKGIFFFSYFYSFFTFCLSANKSSDIFAAVRTRQ